MFSLYEYNYVIRYNLNIYWLISIKIKIVVQFFYQELTDE